MEQNVRLVGQVTSSRNAFNEATTPEKAKEVVDRFEAGFERDW